MAFINDYLTEEEKKRFESYNIMYPRESVHAKHRLGVGKEQVRCTLDRKREIYLFHTRNTKDRFDYGEYIEYFTLVLVKNRRASVMYINLVKESGMTREDKNYDFLWRFRGCNMEKVKDYSKEELLTYLKEALCTFGCCGSVENVAYVVEFEF